MKIKFVGIAVGLAMVGSLVGMFFAIQKVKAEHRERNEVYCTEGIAYNRIDGGYLEVTPTRKCIVETK